MKNKFVIISFIFILGIIFLICGAVIFNNYGFKFFIVNSNSMTGVIDAKSFVVIKKINFGDVQKGDIVAFQNNDLRVKVVHWVVNKNAYDNSLQTASIYPFYALDANPVYEKDFVGVVEWHSKNLGEAILFISNPMILIFGIMATFFAILKLMKT